MTGSKVGQIVWHDLFTSDRERSMAFYQGVANWTFQVERAMDFAWGGGEKSFVLALSCGEAGAGFAETPPTRKNGWITYIEVCDVDAAVKRTERLGGENVRPPFEVPGVGRNALVRDPLGALLGISLSRHSFPIPRRQFGPEVYVTNGREFPHRFYADLFDWRISPEKDNESLVILGPSDDLVAIQLSVASSASSNAVWVPSIKVDSISDGCRIAAANGSRPAYEGEDEIVGASSNILCDPVGALFVLDVAQEHT